jgi:hypothetical protein
LNERKKEMRGKREKKYTRREIRIDLETTKINLRVAMRKNMEVKDTEIKINLIWMKGKKVKYKIKINIKIGRR